MNDSITETTVEVLGKPFLIKCSESQIALLQKASKYFDEKMRYFRSQGVAEFDKIAVIAALNIVHELLTQKAQKENDLQGIHERIHQLQNKVEQALMPGEQIELQTE